MVTSPRYPRNGSRYESWADAIEPPQRISIAAAGMTESYYGGLPARRITGNLYGGSDSRNYGNRNVRESLITTHGTEEGTN